MTEMHDSWREVIDRAEALGLKLKLHLEQEADLDDDTAKPGDTRATIEDLGAKLQSTFDSVGAAAHDEAVRSDVKDIGALLKDALVETFSTVSSDLGETLRKTKGQKAPEADDQAAEGGDPPPTS